MFENYYVEFTGELRDDYAMTNRFFKHYNKWCDKINDEIERLNKEFDDNWKGKPITDYSQVPEYDQWMVSNYRSILKKNGMDKDLFLNYRFFDEENLFAIGVSCKLKVKRLGFVLKKG